MSVEHPVVLVTGAARRVGAEIARELHASGARVALHYRRSKAEAEALAAVFNAERAGSARAFPADLLAPGAPESLVAQVLSHFGRLDGLVNNASSFYATPVGSIDEGVWNDLVGSNLRAPLFLIQAAAPALKATTGFVVNIVDIHAERPLAGYPVYCVAKAGTLGLTRAMAIELAPNVRVNGVSPGPIEWPEDGQFGVEERARIVDHTLMRKAGRPVDIARTVRFLAFDAPYVTGQVIAVDGGRSAHL
jgi:pteridine reductase